MAFNFEENITVESLETVPAEFHGLYVKGADNKFSISPTSKALVDSYVGMSKAFTNESKLKTAANKESAERRLLLKSITDYASELGLTVDEEAKVVEVLQGHIADLTGKVKGGEAMKINLDNVKKQFEKQIADAVNGEKQNTLKMKGSLERHLVGEAATAALSTSGAISPELLMPHVKQQVKVVQNGDDFVAAVVDGEGNVRMNGKGAPMTVADLVAEMKTKPAYAVAFKSEERSGGGVRQQEQNRSVKKDKPEGTSIDQIEAGLNKLQGKK